MNEIWNEIWNFRNMVRLSVPTKRISRIFDIGDLRSGHFCDLLIIPNSMGKKSTPLFLLWRKPIWVESYRIGQLWTIRVKTCIAYPSKGHLRSPEVTNCHLPISFDQKERRGTGVSTFVMVRWIEWYAIWPISVITWPWPLLTWDQTLTLTFQSHFIYGSMRLNKTNTMVSNSLLYL